MPGKRSNAVPVLRLCLINSACRGWECALARDSGDGQFAIPVEQFTSAPQKIRLSVSSKSLHCTFMQRAWRETAKHQDTSVKAHLDQDICRSAMKTNNHFFPLISDGEHKNHVNLSFISCIIRQKGKNNNISSLIGMLIDAWHIKPQITWLSPVISQHVKSRANKQSISPEIPENLNQHHKRAEMWKERGDGKKKESAD